jgi:hypothetical protein
MLKLAREEDLGSDGGTDARDALGPCDPGLATSPEDG